MRYAKGARVEVMKSKERSLGLWRPRKIIGGRGSFYIVKFETYAYACCGESALVQSVLPRSVRPCPPVIEVPWLRGGDVVEVFVNFAWQPATVLEDLGKYHLWVQYGMGEKVNVKKTDVRMKQSWQNDEWVAVRQRSDTSVHGKQTSNIVT